MMFIDKVVLTVLKHNKEHPGYGKAKASFFSLASPFFALFPTFVLYSMVLQPQLASI